MYSLMPNPRPLDSPLTVAEALRFWKKVDREGAGGCWRWTGKCDPNGAGQWHVQGRMISARRVAWELEHPDHDPLHPGVKLYPTCGIKNCVNPAHTLPRVGGGNMPRTHCKRGHAMTGDNIYITTQGKRACRACIKITGQARRKRYEKEGRGWAKTYRPVAQVQKSA